jgi:hypothetical protein
MNNRLSICLLTVICCFFLTTCSRITNPNQVAKPVFSIPSGSHYFPMTVFVTCATEGAVIYYTLDGSTPDENSNSTIGQINLNSATTVKAIAIKEGMDKSRISIADYSLFVPTVVGSCNVQSSGRVIVSGNYAYVLSSTVGFQGLQIINISNPTNPSVVEICTQVAMSDGIINNDYAYLVIGNIGLKIFDISHPNVPSEVGTCDIPYASRIAISGNYAYISGYNPNNDKYNINVIDVSNPASPELLNTFEQEGDIITISAKGRYLYEILYDDVMPEFKVIDVDNPLNLQITGSTFVLYSSRIVLSENYAYLPTYADQGEHGMLQVIGISNPANPYSEFHINTPGYCTDVSQSDGDYIYVADGYPGNCDLPDNEWNQVISVAVSGNYAYVSAHSQDININDSFKIIEIK